MTIPLPDAKYPRPEFASDGARRYYRKKNPYPTDELIQRLDDSALLEHMGVPMRYHPHAIAMHDQPMLDEIENWFQRLPYVFRPHMTYQKERPNLCGVGLVLHGASGTRKTTTAVATLLRLIRMGVPNTDPTGRNFSWHGWAMGRFVDWQSASRLFREAVKDEDADIEATGLRVSMQPGGPMTTRADFLVLDDISRERRTEFNVGELQRTIRRRFDQGYPTIITTNHSPRAWEDTYGDVFAAFLGRAFIPVEF